VADKWHLEAPQSSAMKGLSNSQIFSAFRSRLNQGSWDAEMTAVFPEKALEVLRSLLCFTCGSCKNQCTCGVVHTYTAGRPTCGCGSGRLMCRNCEKCYLPAV
jgi:hypothetical protein